MPILKRNNLFFCVMSQILSNALQLDVDLVMPKFTQASCKVSLDRYLKKGNYLLDMSP